MLKKCYQCGDELQAEPDNNMEASDQVDIQDEGQSSDNKSTQGSSRLKLKKEKITNDVEKTILKKWI